MKFHYLALLLLLTACTADDEIRYKTYGAFTAPDWATQELVITPGTAVFTRYDRQGYLTDRIEMDISADDYMALVALFEENDFSSLGSVIVPEIMVADVGVAEFTFRGKSVKLDPNDPQHAPQNLEAIALGIRDMLERVMASRDVMELPQLMEIAEGYILGSPTYSYDGSGLDFQEMSTIDSYPPVYVLTYTFTSSHAGYGYRSGQVLAQVLTGHTMTLEISRGKVISAVIDAKWDEMGQTLFLDEDTLIFQPRQCETEPWNIWYSQGGINYAAAPSQEQLIQDYYAMEHGILLRDVLVYVGERNVCDACGCPTMHFVRAQTDGRQALIDLGWQ